MTGLPVEQILAFGQLGQGAQQINNQSSATISDAMYKQALQSYYDTQGRNAAEKARMDFLVDQRRLAIDEEAKAAAAAQDWARVDLLMQEKTMLDKGIHPTQTGTAAARRSADASMINAQTGVKAEQRNIAEYLRREEEMSQGRVDKRIEQRLAQDKFYLDQIREARLQATSEAERRKYDLQEQATLTDWLTAAAEADDQFTSEALVGSYYEHAPEQVTRIPYYKEGFFSGSPEFGEFEDESGRILTLGDFKTIAEDAGGTIEEVIQHFVKSSKGK